MANDHDTLIEIKTIVEVLKREMTNHLKHHIDRGWAIAGVGMILLGQLGIQLILRYAFK